MTKTRLAFMSAILLAATVLPIAIQPASAQEPVTGFWTLGVAQLPDYEGSDDTQTLPLLGFRLERGGRGLVLQGTSLRADVLGSARIEAGPVLNYRFGRGDVANPAVAALPGIDGTAELGLYTALSLPAGQEAFRFSAEVLADVGGTHDGLIGTVSAGYGTVWSDRLTVGAALSLTAVSDAYARTYFSVGPGSAAASGLPAHDAGGGLQAGGLDLSVSYAVSDRMSVTGLVSYRRLLGDFADSPVVTTGSADQVTFGLTLSRSF